MSDTTSLFYVNKLHHIRNEKSYSPGDVIEKNDKLYLVHYILYYEVKKHYVVVHYVSQRMDIELVPNAKENTVLQGKPSPLIYYGFIPYEKADTAVPLAQVNSIHRFGEELLRITSIQSLEVQKEGVRFGFTAERLLPENGRTIRQKKREYLNQEKRMRLVEKKGER
ncbi:hypothetical protein [Rossellomorea marisflavi]|uniref:hypothetical protein n=1 Tax=Rossellomorea marisflavi TaxID=189381 RepID=UPI003F9F01AA